MRIHLYQSESSVMLYAPSIFVESSPRNQSSPQIWKIFLKPPRFQEDERNVLSELSILFFENGVQYGGKIKFPLQFTRFEFEVLSYSITKLDEKKIGEKPGQQNTWQMHKCELIVKKEQFLQLSHYLNENKIGWKDL